MRPGAEATLAARGCARRARCAGRVRPSVSAHARRPAPPRPPADMVKRGIISTIFPTQADMDAAAEVWRRCREAAAEDGGGEGREAKGKAKRARRTS